MTELRRPPSVLLAWASLGYGESWAGYDIRRRPAGHVAAPWEFVFRYRPVFGRSRTNVEAAHTKAVDVEAGWTTSDGRWANGWDYGLSVLKTDGTETSVTLATGVQLTPPAHGAWVVRNADWFLRVGLDGISEMSAAIDSISMDNRMVGRDYTVTRTRREKPSRRLKITPAWLDDRGHDDARALVAVCRSGKRFALHRVTGDRLFGTPVLSSIDMEAGVGTSAEATFVETAASGEITDYNLPCSVILDGTNDYLSLADNSTLDPGTGAFSVFYSGTFADTATVALSKGNLGTTDGYGIRRDAAGSLQFFLDGASAAGGPSYASAAWFDGDRHVAVGTYDGAGTARLFMDGDLVATTSITPGSISNAIGLIAGANNGGASGRTTGDLESFGHYGRQLTDAQATSLSGYLLGHPNTRAPAAPTVFVDLRDIRCWSTNETAFFDLTGMYLVTVNGSPNVRGFPLPLAALEDTF